MTTLNARAAFEGYLAALNERDLAALDALLHPDFEDVYPQSGERTRGPANLKAIIENYPGGGWTDQGLERVEGAEDRWVTTPTFTVLRIEEPATSSPAFNGPSIPTAQMASHPDRRDARRTGMANADVLRAEIRTAGLASAMGRGDLVVRSGPLAAGRGRNRRPTFEDLADVAIETDSFTGRCPQVTARLMWRFVFVD